MPQNTAEIYKSWTQKYSESTRRYLQIFLLSHYNIKHQLDSLTRPVNTVYYGTKSLGYIRSKIWELVPADLQTL